jgi:putative component of toxin-antitoxin plasmid stabilization module
VLLTGGDKSTQNADINKARALWEEFNSRDEND